jgi:RNA polymerase sigma-70 factor (ECF subfamily)
VNANNKLNVTDVTAAEIEALPAHHSKALSLFIDGMRYQDIAASIGCPVGTVRSRLNRARGRILAMRAATQVAA